MARSTLSRRTSFEEGSGVVTKDDCTATDHEGVLRCLGGDGSRAIATTSISRCLGGRSDRMGVAAVCHCLSGLTGSKAIVGCITRGNYRTTCRCMRPKQKYRRRLRLGYMGYKGVVRLRYRFVRRVSRRVRRDRKFALRYGGSVLCKIYGRYGTDNRSY